MKLKKDKGRVESWAVQVDDEKLVMSVCTALPHACRCSHSVA
jgi:hypothetical protein